MPVSEKKNRRNKNDKTKEKEKRIKPLNKSAKKTLSLGPEENHLIISHK